MKLRENLRLIFVIATITIISFIGARAGSFCPPDTGSNCESWMYQEWTSTTSNPNCLITVKYHFRLCQDQYQIYVDDVQRSGNCDSLDESWSSNDYNTTFMEWLDVVLIEDIMNLEGQPPYAFCSQESQKAIFYSAGCGIWVKCTYIIDPNRRECEKDWRGNYPDYTENGQQKIDYWKWQSCGVVCCKKTYGICREEGTNEVHIKFISKEKASECTNPDNFVKPCQDGC